uniref:Uncharacterized protein n=1 Tax=Musa acuminata subsp. malaccensis TaxID=214687 RepID=A0A804HYZ4_MUSAM
MNVYTLDWMSYKSSHSFPLQFIIIGISLPH